MHGGRPLPSQSTQPSASVTSTSFRIAEAQLAGRTAIAGEVVSLEREAERDSGRYLTKQK